MLLTVFCQTKPSAKTSLLTSYDTGGRHSVSLLHSGPKPGLFHQSMALQALSSRCFSTTDNSADSDAQEASSSESGVPPRIKFKRLDKTARHIMQACIFLLPLSLKYGRSTLSDDLDWFVRHFRFLIRRLWRKWGIREKYRILGLAISSSSKWYGTWSFGGTFLLFLFACEERLLICDVTNLSWAGGARQ